MAAPKASAPLTIQERILLHLEPHSKARESYAVPREVTQAGIASSLGIRVAHASREVRKLVEGRLVEERDAAVEGSKRHQKAYFLSPSGAQAATLMRRDLGAAVVEAAMAPARREGAARVEGPAHVLRDLPQLRYFFGRQSELDAARKLLETRGVLVVLGIAGIGKSTFGARLRNEMAEGRSTVWYPIHEYDTPASVLAPVARLLALQGRPKLELLAKRGASIDLPQAREVLMEDARGLKTAVFFDDPQAASPEALQALRVLREVATAHAADFKLVLLARTRPPIYDARDVSLKKAVGEIELHGLLQDDAAALLDAGGTVLDAREVYDATGGHPLFIELVRDAGEGAMAKGPDRRQIDRFLQEQVFSKLDQTERDALRRVVFLRRPVDPRVVIAPPATMESLHRLEARSLVRRDAQGRVVAHEAIRDFVRRSMSEEEEHLLSRATYNALQREVEEANRRDDPAYCIALLEDALSLAPDDDVPTLLTRLGGFHLAVAQYNQAVTRLEEALALLQTRPSAPARGLAMLLLGAVHSEAGHGEAARAGLEAAAKEMESGLPRLDPERGRLYLEFGKWEIRYGSAPQARVWIDRALEVGRALAHDYILAEAELLLSHVTPAEQGLEHLERCIDIAKRNEFSPMLSLASTTLSWHLVDLFGDTRRAVDLANQGLRIGQTLGNRVLVGGAHAALGKAHWRSGDLALAQEHARLGMETAEKNFTERIVPMALVATLHTESGQAREGEELARELLGAATKYGTPMEVLSARRSLARALDVQGRYAEAVPLLEECHATYEKMALSCDAPNHIAIMDRLIRMEVAQGHMESAEQWFERAKARLPEVGGVVGGALQAMAFAHLRQRQEPAMAAAHYWRAAQTWKNLEWRLLELKMLVDCSYALSEADAASQSVAAEVPPRAKVEERIAQLSADLKVPRPKPITGSTVA